MALPKKMNGSARARQNATLANNDLITNGRVSSPLAAFSAANGNMVKESVAARKVEISEKRVAM